MDADFASLQGIQNKEYWYAAAAALAWSDYLFTFDQEIEFLWRGRFGWSKVFFVLARYFALFTSIISFDALYPGPGPSLLTTSPFGHYLRNGCGGLAIISSEAILILRTYALYNCNKKLLFILIIVFLAFVGAESYVLLGNVQGHVDYNLAERLKTENTLQNQGSTMFNIFFLEYVLILVFETLIAILTFLRWIRYYRKSTSTFVQALYQDGMFYYVFLCMLSLVNLSMMGSSLNQYLNLLAAFQPVLHAAFAARILFGIRTPHSSTSDISTDTGVVSALKFSPRTDVHAESQDSLA